MVAAQAEELRAQAAEAQGAFVEQEARLEEAEVRWSYTLPSVCRVPALAPVLFF